jgi:hypothetical protein
VAVVGRPITTATQTAWPCHPRIGPWPPGISLAGGTVLAAMVLALVGLGVYPGPLVRLVVAVVAVLH